MRPHTRCWLGEEALQHHKHTRAKWRADLQFLCRPAHPHPELQTRGLTHTHSVGDPCALTCLRQKPLLSCGTQYPHLRDVPFVTSSPDRASSSPSRCSHTSIYRVTWPVSAPAPQMIGNGSRTIQKPKHSDSQQATSARLRYGDKERSGVEQREGKMGLPLNMAHAEVPCPRGQAPIWPQIAGPLPLRSSSSTHPHTYTHSGYRPHTRPPLGQITEAQNISSRKGTGIIRDPIPSSEDPPFLEDFLDK